MERCERCEKFFDIKQDEGDYVYFRKENDQIAHTFCNDCLESDDYAQIELRQELGRADKLVDEAKEHGVA